MSQVIPDPNRFDVLKWSYPVDMILKYLIALESNVLSKRGVILTGPLINVRNDMKRLTSLFLKGAGVITPDTTDDRNEYERTFRGLSVIAREYNLNCEEMILIFKKLDNLLCVIEYSHVPTLVLSEGELIRLITFFHTFKRTIDNGIELARSGC
jgi:hypothetical protein